jgi:hypothetical protein
MTVQRDPCHVSWRRRIVEDGLALFLGPAVSLAWLTGGRLGLGGRPIITLLGCRGSAWARSRMILAVRPWYLHDWCPPLVRVLCFNSNFPFVFSFSTVKFCFLSVSFPFGPFPLSSS